MVNEDGDLRQALFQKIETTIKNKFTFGRQPSSEPLKAAFLICSIGKWDKEFNFFAPSVEWEIRYACNSH